MHRWRNSPAFVSDRFLVPSTPHGEAVVDSGDIFRSGISSHGIVC